MAATPCAEDAPGQPSPAAQQIKTPEQLNRQVFISYTSQDKEAQEFACSILAPALYSAGMNVYGDSESLEAGDRWDEKLMDAAANSRVVVAVISPTYLQRFRCMLELDLALHARSGCSQRPLVIPVFVDTPGEGIDAAAVKLFWQQAAQQQLLAEQAAQKQERQQWQRLLSPIEKQWIQPERWARNITVEAEKKQNLHLQGYADFKDAKRQLACAVVQRVVHMMPVQAALPTALFGMEEQQDELQHKLQDRMGVWLYGAGECS